MSDDVFLEDDEILEVEKKLHSQGHKKCIECLELKPLTDFYMYKKDRKLFCRCKKCHNKICAENKNIDKNYKKLKEFSDTEKEIKKIFPITTGLTPRNIIESQRISEIVQFINYNIAEKKSIPLEWIQEYNEKIIFLNKKEK